MDHQTRLIALEEGCKLAAYQDSRAIWTIGYGYNLPAHGYSPEECEGLTWTQEQAEQALADEIEVVESELDRRWPHWRDLDEVRRAAIVSSVYQLGAPGAAHFVATIAALQAHDWATAAQQMLASRWAKQTPARVQRNAAMIQSGQWPEDVNGTQFLPAPEPAAPAPVADAPADVAATPSQPSPRVLPPVPADAPAASPTVGQPVGGGVSALLAGLTPYLKRLSVSKTMYGVVGMVALQLFGQAPWDIRIWIAGHIYDIPDLHPYVITALGALATWGRITAKPIKGAPHA